MIQRYNRLSLAIGAPSIILYIVCMVLMVQAPQTQSFFTGPILILLLLACKGLLFVGCLFYAKAKGRNELWALFIFLGIIGLIVLACLEDRSAPPGVEYCICCGKPYQLDNAPLKCPSCNVRLKIEADQRG